MADDYDLVVGTVAPRSDEDIAFLLSLEMKDSLGVVLSPADIRRYMANPKAFYPTPGQQQSAINSLFATHGRVVGQGFIIEHLRSYFRRQIVEEMRYMESPFKLSLDERSRSVVLRGR